jgi:hypothetical protein
MVDYTVENLHLGLKTGGDDATHLAWQFREGAVMFDANSSIPNREAYRKWHVCGWHLCSHGAARDR